MLDGLLRLLDVRPLGDGRFQGRSPAGGPQRVFGGQVAAQALTAAGRTVPADRHVHSLHAYFVRPGRPDEPIEYAVDDVRDGRSFSIRRVVASQSAGSIFVMSASFQHQEPGLDHAVAAPAVPDPLTLPSLAERSKGVGYASAAFGRIPRPFDIRYVNDPPWQAHGRGPQPGAGSRAWFRADGRLPDDPLVHVCLLAYLSDLTLLDSILLEHGLAHGYDNLQSASLDHAMWFHRPVRLDDWVLYDTNSPSSSGARGLATGHFFGRNGALLATVVQEGLVRVRTAGDPRHGRE
ncbi:acyl-CoA thioesterase II [Nakamurella sp. YIM 132084]|uniref:Acyl-CoA thioesterase 2 n=1 Tax=Nakamurella leprariae TaxID=2803911 RepID=A0A939C170_9ACTN|nr:acyl-CoA thioesterase II [Nakamurella leprariae]